MTKVPSKEYSLLSNTSDILVDKLVEWKVDLIFSLAGDGINPIFEALRKRKEAIRLITVRHEEAAAFMASGYAKATGKLGVCLGTTGPGAVHLLNGLYDATMEGAPVLAITGMMPNDVLGTKFFQEIDTISLMGGLAVYNQRVNGPVHAQTVVDLACRAALLTRGVAHLAIATDVQQKVLEEDKHSKKAGHLTGSSTLKPRRETPTEEELEEVAALLNASKKIMILAGRGALQAKAELRQVAEKLQAPVAKALLGKALLPDDSPYTTGGIGRLGTMPSKQMMDECETLLILGSNMPYMDYYPKNARGIQVDSDPQRIGLRYPVEIGLTGDVQATLEALLPKLKQQDDKSFLLSAQQKMKGWRETLNRLEGDTSVPIKPPHLVATVAKLINDDAHISVDTGAHTVFTGRHFPIKEKQELIACGNLASMAPGLPYALAAQLAYPGRQCIAMVGDGSFTMLMGEMATAVLYNLPVKVIVFKNNSLAMDKFEQEEIGGQEYGIALQPVNFAKIAEACGAEGYTCSDPAQLSTVLSQALSSPNPAVIEVEVDPQSPPDPPEKLSA